MVALDASGHRPVKLVRLFARPWLLVGPIALLAVGTLLLFLTLSTADFPSLTARTYPQVWPLALTRISTQQVGGKVQANS
jgi:hypothetical protein